MTDLASLERAMRACDSSLDAHCTRVLAHARIIAKRLGWSELELRDLDVGVALHDVGKVAVAPEVLSKPASLDSDELAQIRAHPVEGAWLVSQVPSLRRALPYVLFHHERWDGQGYPTRRRGEAIPLEGRLLAVADAFDAMTSSRPYRAAIPADLALGELEACAGTQFDPDVAAAFLDAWAAGEVESEHALSA